MFSDVVGLFSVLLWFCVYYLIIELCGYYWMICYLNDYRNVDWLIDFYTWHDYLSTKWCWEKNITWTDTVGYLLYIREVYLRHTAANYAIRPNLIWAKLRRTFLMCWQPLLTSRRRRHYVLRPTATIRCSTNLPEARKQGVLCCSSSSLEPAPSWAQEDAFDPRL